MRWRHSWRHCSFYCLRLDWLNVLRFRNEQASLCYFYFVFIIVIKKITDPKNSLVFGPPCSFSRFGFIMWTHTHTESHTDTHRHFSCLINLLTLEQPWHVIKCLAFKPTKSWKQKCIYMHFMIIWPFVTFDLEPWNDTDIFTIIFPCNQNL